MIGSQFVEECFMNSDWLLVQPIKGTYRLRKLWKLIGKGVLNFFGSRFFDRRKDKLIFDDNNQKTQWEKDFKLLAPENWTNGELKTLADFSKMWITARIFRCLSRTVRYHSCHGNRINYESSGKTENSEYLGLSIQFGFVILFSSAFPLAPLFAIILNFLKIRTNAKQLTKYSKRTTPKEFFIFFLFDLIWPQIDPGWPKMTFGWTIWKIMKENFWYWDLGRYFPIFSVFINSDKWCSTRFYFKYCN